MSQKTWVSVQSSAERFGLHQIGQGKECKLPLSYVHQATSLHAGVDPSPPATPVPAYKAAQPVFLPKKSALERLQRGKAEGQAPQRGR